MTNQTAVFSVLNVHGNLAAVTDAVNQFIKDGIDSGIMSNFHIQPVVVNASSDPGKLWYTVQVNYYNSEVQEG